MITETPSVAKTALITTIRNECRAAYQRSDRQDRRRRYFIKKHRRGYKVAYRRRVVSFKDGKKFYPATYCFDRRGYIYTGCDGLYRPLDHISGYSQEDIRNQEDINRADQCGYQHLNLKELDEEVLRQLLLLIRKIVQ